jgi:hypothetical protein
MARNTRTRIADDPLDGAGPFRFRPDADLGPGETFVLDLREEPRNGKKGGYKRYLPFDESQITNESTGAALDVTYNGVFDQYVLPNAVESFDQTGIVRVEVRNASATDTVAAADLTVELVETPYDADDAARAEAERGQLAHVVEKFTGLKLRGGR